MIGERDLLGEGPGDVDESGDSRMRGTLLVARRSRSRPLSLVCALLDRVSRVFLGLLILRPTP